ncbi:MAG: hypothetical protein K9J16_11140 [Melioribacteraceae bacterium]|nr:hypothetical protein [Melioribacteraceae bacterium]MCF8355553.1 hypothetical protein [Melioribacteraceae bacterium]MCF8394228.1 hypothetical protein [Melioribacteraceae bacterium]MCF8419948.1 hypothetical protein [Melioribacteraceae bacterium]
MQYDTKELLEKFETEIWLLIDGSLAPRRKSFWENLIENNSEIKAFYDQTIELLNTYENNSAIELEQSKLNKMIDKIIEPESVFKKIKKFLLIKNGSEGFDSNGLYRIAFGSVMVVCAIVLFMVSEKPNPVKNISSGLLEWNSGEVAAQLSEIETKIFFMQNEKIKQYIMYEKTKDQWSREIYSIEQDINLLIENANDESL